VCDLETSRIGAPYIYNVRLLRVKKAETLKDRQAWIKDNNKHAEF
jgi:hypothetical protein